MTYITSDTRFAIKAEVCCNLLGWGIRDCELIRSGTKSGRPNWEVENHYTRERFSSTAFDENDIYDLHKVEC